MKLTYKETQNCNGLTFAYWLNATGLPIQNLLPHLAIRYNNAWIEGEDPTEYHPSISTETEKETN